MTLKHIKFDDSQIMRNFEKIAIKKELISPEKMTKTASTTIDLSPTNDLTQNLLKLSSGLRHFGLISEASELEHNFGILKTAEQKHIYNTHDETGEDVINFAHPDGGKRLDKDWSDLGEVETILEKHEKIKKVVNKQPTGKLAALVMQIKKIAQDALTDQDKNDTINYIANQLATAQTHLDSFDKTFTSGERAVGTLGTIFNVVSPISNLFVNNARSLYSQRVIADRIKGSIAIHERLKQNVGQLLNPSEEVNDSKGISHLLQNANDIKDNLSSNVVQNEQSLNAMMTNLNNYISVLNNINNALMQFLSGNVPDAVSAIQAKRHTEQQAASLQHQTMDILKNKINTIIERATNLYNKVPSQNWPDANKKESQQDTYNMVKQSQTMISRILSGANDPQLLTSGLTSETFSFESKNWDELNKKIEQADKMLSDWEKIIK